MTQTNDGGPAFPIESEGLKIGLRDWFAGQALASMDTDSRFISERFQATDFMKDVARRAYIIADAMLAERAKERE